MTTHPPLPPEVVIAPGFDVDDAWERYAIFEALHHDMNVCNPMRPPEMDRFVDALAVPPGAALLDVACGYGALLHRLADEHDVAGTGVDESPWMLAGAIRRAGAGATPLRWVLAEAAAWTATLDQVSFDAVTCLGASWIWSGFSGTARALERLVRPGGIVAIGDLRLRDGADPDDAAAALGGRPTTVDDQDAAIRSAGLESVTELVSPDDAWEDYHRRVLASARTWRGPDPGDEDPLAVAGRWMDDFRRDHEWLSWTVRIARRTS